MKNRRRIEIARMGTAEPWGFSTGRPTNSSIAVWPSAPPAYAWTSTPWSRHQPVKVEPAARNQFMACASDRRSDRPPTTRRGPESWMPKMTPSSIVAGNSTRPTAAGRSLSHRREHLAEATALTDCRHRHDRRWRAAPQESPGASRQRSRGVHSQTRAQSDGEVGHQRGCLAAHERPAIGIDPQVRPVAGCERDRRRTAIGIRAVLETLDDTIRPGREAACVPGVEGQALHEQPEGLPGRRCILRATKHAIEKLASRRILKHWPQRRPHSTGAGPVTCWTRRNASSIEIRLDASGAWPKQAHIETARHAVRTKRRRSNHENEVVMTTLAVTRLSSGLGSGGLHCRPRRERLGNQPGRHAAERARIGGDRVLVHHPAARYPALFG